MDLQGNDAPYCCIFLVFPKIFEFKAFVSSLDQQTNRVTCLGINSISGSISEYKLLFDLGNHYRDDGKLLRIAVYVIEESDIAFSFKLGELFKSRADLTGDKTLGILCGTSGGSNELRHRLGQCIPIACAVKFDRGEMFQHPRDSYLFSSRKSVVAEHKLIPFLIHPDDETLNIDLNPDSNPDPTEPDDQCRFCYALCTNSICHFDPNTVHINNGANIKAAVVDMETYEFFRTCDLESIHGYTCLRIISDLSSFGEDFKYPQTVLNEIAAAKKKVRKSLNFTNLVEVLRALLGKYKICEGAFELPTAQQGSVVLPCSGPTQDMNLSPRELHRMAEYRGYQNVNLALLNNHGWNFSEQPFESESEVLDKASGMFSIDLSTGEFAGKYHVLFDVESYGRPVFVNWKKGVFLAADHQNNRKFKVYGFKDYDSVVVLGKHENISFECEVFIEDDERTRDIAESIESPVLLARKSSLQTTLFGRLSNKYEDYSNYANCDGFYYKVFENVRINGKEICFNGPKRRFIGWNGYGWAITDFKYYSDILKNQGGFGYYHQSINGNVVMEKSEWIHYSFFPKEPFSLWNFSFLSYVEFEEPAKFSGKYHVLFDVESYGRPVFVNWEKGLFLAADHQNNRKFKAYGFKDYDSVVVLGKRENISFECEVFIKGAKPKDEKSKAFPARLVELREYPITDFVAGNLRTKPDDSSNYANCDGFYYKVFESVKINGKEIYFNGPKSRFIGWNGYGWAITDFKYYSDILKNQGGFGYYHQSINGNVPFPEARWEHYD